jgi:hypothetical protein
MDKKLASAVALILILSALGAFSQSVSAEIVFPEDEATSHVVKEPNGYVRLNRSEMNGSSGYHFASGLRNNWIQVHYINDAQIAPIVSSPAKLYYTTNGTTPTTNSPWINLILEPGQIPGPVSSGYYSGNLTTANFTGLSDGTEITFIVKVTGTSGITQATDTLWDNNTDGWGAGKNGYRYKLDMGKPVISNVAVARSGLDIGGYANITAAVTDASAGVDTVKVNIAGPGVYGTKNVTMQRVTGTSVFYNSTAYSIPGTYNYFIWTSDAAGNVNVSAVKSFVIGNVKPEINDVRATPHAQLPGGTVNVSAIVTDNSQLGAVKLDVYSGPQGFATFNTTMTKSSSGRYYYNRTYTLAGSYNYKISASDASGNYNESLGTFSIVTPPAKVAGLTATPGNAKASLSWSVSSSGGSPILKYYIYRGPSATSVSKIAESASPYYNNTGLSNGQTYYYCVSAVNAVGEGAKSDAASAIPRQEPTVPSAPLGIAASAGNEYVLIVWAAPSDNGGYAVSEYRIYRNGELYKSVSQAGYNDTGLVNGVSYTYNVSAVNFIGEGPRSASVIATPHLPYRVPEKVAGLAAEAGDAKVSLSWLQPDNGGSPITYYTIYRGGVEIAHSTAVAYIDTTAANGVLYSYQVSARNIAGEGPKSDAVSVSPGAAGSADSDGDGVPDEVEEELGTNPGSPSDSIRIDETNGSLLSTTNGTKYYDWETGEVRETLAKDVDGDGINDYAFDSKGDGKYNYYYSSKSGTVQAYSEAKFDPAYVVIIVLVVAVIAVAVFVAGKRK